MGTFLIEINDSKYKWFGSGSEFDGWVWGILRDAAGNWRGGFAKKIGSCLLL